MEFVGSIVNGSVDVVKFSGPSVEFTVVVTGKSSTEWLQQEPSRLPTIRNNVKYIIIKQAIITNLESSRIKNFHWQKQSGNSTG